MRYLYKILAAFLFVAYCTSLFAQVRTVTFTGRDRTNQYHIPLSQVKVFNLDQLWEEVLYYPDTILVLGSVGVEDYETGQNLQLMQNVPNPFDGTTEFALQLPDDRDVLLEIYDITGHLAVGEKFAALSAGTHLFQATLSSPQTYLLSAKVDNGQMTIKMVNTGYGAKNTIRHLGMTDKNGDFTIYLKNDKASSGYPFHVGDEMQYIGSAVVDERLLESEVVTQAQVDNETLSLLFDVTVPTVTTRITSVSATSADGGGFVTNSGGSPVTMRGICWSTFQNPTIADNHTDDGSGTGSFNSTMTDLTPNTTYYLRAYATNSVGTGYGEQRTFTTACNPVNVNITGNTNINYGQSTTLTASGADNYQWSTGATISSITLSPSSTTTYTVTGTNSYGCTATASVTVTVNPVAPTVTTNNVSNIQPTSVTCGGNVTSDGGAPVTQRGVCWSTSQNPTVSGSHTTNGNSTGTFTSNLTGLTPNTTYYVRAYATNSAGTACGEQKSFITPCNTVNVNIAGSTTINYGQSTTLTASGANSYQWSTNATTANITVSPTTTTTYTVTGTNSYGCTATASVTVTVNPVAPTVTTNNVSNIQATSATCGGNVTSHGGAAVTARGVCWSTSPNPTISGSHTTNGSSTGTFTSSLTGLTPNTTYYVRAYATNSVGTAYGEQKILLTSCNTVNVNIAGSTTINYGQSTTLTASGANSYRWSNNATTTNITVSPTTTTTYTVTGTNNYGCTATAIVTVTVNPIAPTVTTSNVTDISTTTASCGGNVTSTGGSSVTARGVCWSTLQNPTVSDSHTTNGSGTGDFTSSITSLTPNTTYYVRAYATNSAGTNYGEQKSFTTNCNAVTVSISGTTTINYGQSTTLTASGAGNYSWNTGATTASITVSPTSTTTYTVTGTNNYGCTATASVTVTVNPVAPTVTTNNVSNIQATSATCGGNVTSHGGAAVTARGVCWSTSPNPTVNGSHTTNGSDMGTFTSNLTGLSPNTIYYVRAYATNSVETVYGEQKQFKTSCVAMSVSITGNNNINYGQSTTLTASGADNYQWSTNATTASIVVDPTSTTTYTVTGTNSNGCTATASVTVTVNYLAPTVTTDNVTDISHSSATCGGNVTFDGGKTVTARGVCWSSSPNPTVSNNHTEDGNGLGSFASSITGLNPNTTYYVRAYAINSVGTAYGVQKTFTTSCNTVAVSISGNTIIDYGQSTTLTASGANSYRWSNNATTTNITVSPTSTTTYTVTGTNSYGCTTTASVTVIVNPIAPTVTTSNVTDIQAHSATCGGNVISDGGSTVTIRGICWSTSQNPTVDDNNIPTDGIGTDIFTCSMTGLTPNTIYYVRAYAINSVDTAYGEQQQFKTSCVAMNVNITGNTTINYGESTTLTASGANSYQWSTNATTASIVVDPTSTTTYTVTGTNSNGCTATASVTVTVNPVAPTVTTNNVSNIQATSVTCGGNVTSHGGAAVTARGVCWSTSPNPTVSDSHTTNGSGTGAFTSSITGLTPNTTYFVRAYATNSAGTNYGEQKTFTTSCNTVTVSISGTTTINYGQSTTLTASGADNYSWNTGATTASITVSPTSTTTYTVTGTNSYGCTATASKTMTVNPIAPTVTTSNVTDITTTTASCSGNVTSTGGSSVTARGVCWSTSQNPTVNGSHTTNGTGIGSFTSSISSLTPNTTYYVRAYATNSAGTAYGSQVSFTTAQDGQPCPAASTVTDYDGNTYNTVQIGNLCWMKENLRTTHYADGTAIPACGSCTSSISPYYYNNSSSGISLTSRGYQYNWPAAVHSAASSSANPSGVQGICPNGWHVPSDAEWTQLTDYVSSQSQYVCGSNNTYIAKALASTTGWGSSITTCAVGNDQSGNNTTGFSAVPAGVWYAGFNNVGYSATFWSSTQYNNSSAYFRYFSATHADVNSDITAKQYGCSVRCLRDNNGGGTNSLPSVTTNTVGNITDTSVTCGGNVTADGSATVTARGVCWSTSQNPSVNGNHTTDGNGTGSFTSSITGLTAGITYYVRAYATNSMGTAYGAQNFFTTTKTNIIDEKSCPSAPTVTDHEGNVYATVQIGNQCWMRDNLRTTTSPSTGTYLIPAAGTGATRTGKQARWYNNDSTTYAPMNYGLLYNWNAAVDTFNTAYGETSVTTGYNNEVNVSFTGNRRGICPAGWHLPSNDEWTTLTNYVSGQNEYQCSGNSTYIAKALTSTTGWNTDSDETCAVGNDPTTNNATGFSAVPAGSADSFFYLAGGSTDFWSSTQNYSNTAWTRNLNDISATVYISANAKFAGYSVRCLRDAGTAVIDEKSCPAAPTVTDHEGNVYATVQIGSQCWMRDNLRTTTSPSTGTYLIPAAGTTYTYTGKQARWYNDDSTTYAPMNYGLLYNWNAAVDTFNTAYGETSVNTSYSNAVSVRFTENRRGICPSGWHLPSYAEWTTLTTYVGTQSEDTCGGNSTYIAKALAATTGWNSSTNTCAVGNTPGNNNATGFSAFPTGLYNGSYGNSGYNACFWSSRESGSYDAWRPYLGFNNACVYRNYFEKYYGYSVRCVRD